MTKIVIKFGGSAITRKRETTKFSKVIGEIISKSHEYIKYNDINKLGRAVFNARTKDPDLQLVILNGAGPFGHYLVNERGKGDMTITPDLVHQSVEHLNYEVASKLEACGVKTVSIHPFNTCSFDGEHNISELWNIAKAYMNVGSTPIPMSYGDLVPTVGCRGEYFAKYQMISADDLAVKIAKDWSADKIIMVTDVSGVYTEDPSMPNTKLIQKIVTDKDFGRVIQKHNIRFSESGIDITKGLFGKVSKLCKAAYETGILSQICGVDGLEAALAGKEVGTLIVRQ